MAKKIIMMQFFISVDIDNYHDTFQIFIYFKFKGRLLLLSESCRNQTVICGFKLVFLSEHDKHFTFLIFFFYTFPVIFP